MFCTEKDGSALYGGGWQSFVWDPWWSAVLLCMGWWQCFVWDRWSAAICTSMGPPGGQQCFFVWAGGRELYGTPNGSDLYGDLYRFAAVCRDSRQAQCGDLRSATFRDLYGRVAAQLACWLELEVELELGDRRVDDGVALLHGAVVHARELHDLLPPVRALPLHDSWVRAGRGFNASFNEGRRELASTLRIPAY